MTENRHKTLLNVLLCRYETFRFSLARRLGSDVKAREALHAVYLRLNNSGTLSVASPQAYLFRMAVNAATDERRIEQRALNLRRACATLVDRPHDLADPLRALEAKQEVAILGAAINELTVRRRTILLASRIQGLTLAQISVREGISQRMVEMELKYAITHCAEKLGRPVVQRFGPKASATSSL